MHIRPEQLLTHPQVPTLEQHNMQRHARLCCCAHTAQTAQACNPASQCTLHQHAPGWPRKSWHKAMTLAASGGYPACAAAAALPSVTELSKITRSKGIKIRMDIHSKSTAWASQRSDPLLLVLVAAWPVTKPSTCRTGQQPTVQALSLT
jgi:hypothetical protein